MGASQLQNTGDDSRPANAPLKYSETVDVVQRMPGENVSAASVTTMLSDSESVHAKPKVVGAQSEYCPAAHDDGQPDRPGDETASKGVAPTQPLG